MMAREACAAQASRLDESFFHQIVEAASAAMILIDREHRVVFANRSAKELFGYTRSEIAGSPIQMLLSEDGPGQPPKLDPTMGPHRLIAKRKDGSELPIELDLKPITGSGESLSLASIQDASRRERAEATLRKSEQRSSMILESILDHAVLTLDSHGAILTWNAGARRLMGYQVDEIVGHPVSRLFPAEDVERCKQERELEAAAASGNTRADGWRVRRDGSRFMARSVTTAIRDDDGAVCGFIQVIRDLTQRRLAEEKFKCMVEAAPIGMVMVTGEGRMRLVNAQMESQFGYAPGELTGQPIELLVPSRFQHHHADHRRRYFAAPEPRMMGKGRDLFGIRKDGSEFPIEIGLSPFELTDERIVMASIIDISERKRIEDELRRSNDELEQFAYIASHDLQEPLRMVASYTELLAQRYRGQLDEKADKYIFYAVDGAKRMQRLVADLLAYSRLNSQDGPLLSVSSETVVERVLKTFEAAISDAQAEIELRHLPIVLANEGQLEHLFSNLIGNALKFRGEAPPRIEIDAVREHDRWLFTISDTGIGFDMRYAERIFQMFQRLNERDKHEGSGIGLAIAKRIVEQHGGMIRVESQPGAGTTFSFTLPPGGAGAAT